MAEKLNLTTAQLPRKWQPPRRIDEGEVAHNFADYVAYHRVESWFAFLDVIVQEIKERFSKQLSALRQCRGPSNASCKGTAV